MSKKNLFFTIFVLFISFFALSSCGQSQADTDTSNTISENDITNLDDKKYSIYLLAKQSGYNGTYEEWLSSIRGDFIQLRVNSGNIEWKYSKDSTWTTLISLSLLSGKDGREVEFSTNATHIIWRYVGEAEWKN